MVFQRVPSDLGRRGKRRVSLRVPHQRAYAQLGVYSERGAERGLYRACKNATSLPILDS